MLSQIKDQSPTMSTISSLVTLKLELSPSSKSSSVIFQLPTVTSTPMATKSTPCWLKAIKGKWSYKHTKSMSLNSRNKKSYE